MASIQEACLISIARGRVEKHCFDATCIGYYDGATSRRAIPAHETPPFPTLFPMSTEEWINTLRSKMRNPSVQIGFILDHLEHDLAGLLG